MATNQGVQERSGWKMLLDELPLDQLKDDLRQSFSNVSERALGKAGEKLNGVTDQLNDAAEGGGLLSKVATEGAKEKLKGGSPVKGALKGGLAGVKDTVKEKLGGGGGKKSGKGPKAVNIIEQIDVGVPVRVAYNQWTQFQDFSNFMKKVDGVEQEDETKVNFKAQVFWSHRTWEGQIVEQVPDDKIVWRSKGAKGYVDGAVTFHELAPHLTRILVVLEYHPQGLFERTGNLWRAQGRRARLELKHFRRHVMTQVITNPDEVEGWRGEIHDGEVTRSHEDVVQEEQQDQPDERDEDQRADEIDDEYDDEPEDTEGEPEDEYDEGDEPEETEGEPEDEYDEPEDVDDEPEDVEPEDDEPEDEYDESEEVDEADASGDDDEPEKPRKRRRRAA